MLRILSRVQKFYHIIIQKHAVATKRNSGMYIYIHVTYLTQITQITQVIYATGQKANGH